MGLALPANADGFNLTVDHRTEIIEAYSVDDQGTEGRTGLRQYPRLRAVSITKAPPLTMTLCSPWQRNTIYRSMTLKRKTLIGCLGRYADLTWRDAYRLRLGLVTSQWGLGLVANNGLTDRQEQTDLSQIREAALNAALHGLGTGARAEQRVFVAGDYLTSIVTGEDSRPGVLGDDILLPGDTAQQIIAAWQARFLPQLDGGLYFVQRWQESSEGSQLAIRVVDLYFNSKRN